MSPRNAQHAAYDRTSSACLRRTRRLVAALCVLGTLACSEGSESDALAGQGASGTTGDAGATGDDAATPGDPLEAAIEHGLVRGTSRDGVRSFFGIPYAAPPTGDARWLPPQPVEPWSEVRMAVEPASTCPQISPSTRAYAGDEDCLYLNVFTPDPAPSEPRPVLVWMHGGAFVFGSGSDASYDGAHLVSRGDVIVVTLNYRLGALGYLAHAALSAEHGSQGAGSYGVLDQRAALQWVQRNIAAFGGDPDQVTIFGESAGGHSVCWHLLSTGSHGLYARAIVESGYCMKPTYTLEGAHAQGARFARALGCDPSDDVLACLREKSPEEIVQASQSSGSTPGGVFYQAAESGFAFEPIVDGVQLTGPMAELFADGASADVPVVHGFNTHEGVLFHVAVLGNVTPVMDEAEYLAALTERFGVEGAAQVAEQYPVANYASANDALAEVSGDAFFVCPARAMARALEQRGRTSYLYRFGALLTGVPFPQLQGTAFHSAELPYVWGNAYPLGSVPPEEQPIADAIQDAFLQHATSGNPNPAQAPEAWPAYAAQDDTLQSFGPSSIATASGVKRDECDFWATIELPIRP